MSERFNKLKFKMQLNANQQFENKKKDVWQIHNAKLKQIWPFLEYYNKNVTMQGIFLCVLLFV